MCYHVDTRFDTSKPESDTGTIAMSKSTAPSKPRKDFPLFPHQTGRWCKKVLGRHEYFGGVADDPNGEKALKLWLDRKDDLLAGRRPQLAGDQVTVRDLLNRFRGAKKDLFDSGEIVRSTYTDWVETCDLLKDFFGLTRTLVSIRSEDFERLRAKLAKSRGPVALGNEIQRVRCVFRYAYEAELLDSAVRFGPSFKRPSRKVLRKARIERGPRMFAPAELHAILGEAGPQLRAMTMLALNCGFGNADCGRLPNAAIDFKNCWIDFARPKTGIERRCPLWPETIQALKVAIGHRPEPADSAHSDLVFITKYRGPWHKETSDNPVTKEFAKVLKALNLTRKGRNFYTLRHVFATIGGEAKDAPALSAIMGHDPGDMASIYREAISDDRLQAVVNHVRAWLFPATAKKRKPR